MSSFVGHGLAAAVAFALGPRPARATGRALWLGGLVAMALAPDVDYAIRALALGPDRRLRITHSLALCLLLPALGTGALRAAGVRGRALAVRGAQAAGAGLSHVALDLLVGVTALPLFWPASDRRVRLPWGLLPSAGRLDPRNPLFYRNLFIELGVLLPLAAALVLSFGPRRPARPRGITIASLVAIAAGFAAWASTLPR
ncbi:MAG TPA: metal-dependent hydrolase [Polyangiaceae bacterium]|nr:metal-dependent hydrolase [Polyangiaceae bacterium]